MSSLLSREKHTPSFTRVPLLTKMVVFIIWDYDMKTCILNFLSVRVHIWNLATIRKNNDPSWIWTHMLEMVLPLLFDFIIPCFILKISRNFRNAFEFLFLCVTYNQNKYLYQTFKSDLCNMLVDLTRLEKIGKVFPCKIIICSWDSLSSNSVPFLFRIQFIHEMSFVLCEMKTIVLQYSLLERKLLKNLSDGFLILFIKWKRIALKYRKSISK